MTHSCMRMSASLKSNTLVTKEALEDHLVAHDVNHSNSTGITTDSALAQLLFEEENWNERNVNSSTETSIQDHLLARRLHQEEMHKQEEKSFNNLKVSAKAKYGCTWFLCLIKLDVDV